MAGAVALAIGTALVFPVVGQGHRAVLNDVTVPWWAMVIPLAFGVGLELRFRVKSTLLFATVAEFPLVVGLFATPGQGLVISLALGGVLALAVLRYPLHLLFYNVAGFAFEIAIAIVVFRRIVPIGGGSALQAWLGAVSAMVICAVAGSARVALLSVFRRRRLDRDRWSASVLCVTVAVINSTIAFLALRLVVADPMMIWLVAGLLVVMVIAYRNYISLLSHHEGLNRLYDSTRSFELVTAQEGSVRTMLNQSVELLGAESAELALMGAPGGAARYFRAGQNAPAAEVSTWQGDLDGEIAATECVTDPSSRVMVGRLQGSDGVIGVLRVSMFSGTEFSEGDRRLFEMFVNHASVALQNCQLVDQLRDEVNQREHEALHDALTALPNRVMFDLETRRAIAGRREGDVLAVALIDLDHFKEVNDTLGHHRGDELLAQLSRRLESLAAERRLVVSRLGGDEFAVLMTEASTVEEIEAIVADLKYVVEERVEIENVRIDVNASIGVSVVDDGAVTVDGATLLRQADVAMYIAKRQHLGTVFYDRSDDPYSPRRLSLAADLRHAVERGEIEAFFQPEIDLHTGEVISVEALARWTHPVHGKVVPDQFIPIAEQSGLIRDLTYLMLDQSLERIREWRRHGFELNVAVNLSVRCLSDEGLVDTVMAALDRVGLGPECLTLEVTEGTIMADPDHAIAVLGRLHARGIRLSIDDFGMGYSSLAQLKRMPVGQLKVDRSFVTFVSEDADDQAIVKSVTDLGHNLGLEVIAEGVEDQPTLDKLVELGCDSVQGFYLARPMSGDETLRWLRDRREAESRRLEPRPAHSA